MKIIDSYPTIETLFDKWRDPLGRDFVPYRNHVYRVFNFAVVMSGADEEGVEKLAVISAFHDVGIWLDKTFDYIEPSVTRASEFLLQRQQCAWISIVARAIRAHHKIFPWTGNGSNLVESFRRADWLDVCLFMLPTRLERSGMHAVLQTFPRKGFHGRLVVLSLPWILRHPLRPLPMFRL
jgi:hypothetical protein